jgi:hypothetical protein
MSFNAPVLLIAFNSPENSKLVFEKIKKIRPAKFYFSVDGPRIGDESDDINCRLTREIVNQVDWACELHTKFGIQNLGCGYGVSTAISWVFEKEETCIILEDDCLPSLSFFPFCEELLEKYKNNPEVWMISGNNYSEDFKLKESFTFSYTAHHIWGWATWKRAWQEFDISREYFFNNKIRNFKKLLVSRQQVSFFSDRFERFYRNKNITHTWDFQWTYTIMNHAGLTIVPEKNLVTNIGAIGSHTHKSSVFQNLPIDNNFKIKNYPTFVQCNYEYDQFHYKNHWLKLKRDSIFKRILKKVNKWLNNE